MSSRLQVSMTDIMAATFLDYPELELSKNLAENSIRGVAISRNYVQGRIMQSRLRLDLRSLIGSGAG